MNEAQCVVCGGDHLSRLEEFSTLPRVTSDCKPWPAGGTLCVCEDCGMPQKNLDAHWKSEIDKIYDGYDIYALSNGAEQIIFSADGTSRPRSRTLVDYVAQALKQTSFGALIDIGSGNGEALSNFSIVLPGFSLYGTELSDRNLERLRSIRNFVTLYTGSLSEIEHRFDVVTMVHVLEHIPKPADFLREALALLAPNGKLLIEVPDADSSPFDFLIADHRSHFTRAHLAYLVERAGLSVISARDDVLPKEVTVLATHAADMSSAPRPYRDPALTRARMVWLAQTLATARQTASDAESFGIFGTSIAGMWLYGALREHVDFFVDEDESRIGCKYDGRPIISPRDVPSHATVFMPMVRKTAEIIVGRLAGSSRARWGLPPEET